MVRVSARTGKVPYARMRRLEDHERDSHTFGLGYPVALARGSAYRLIGGKA